MNSQLSFCLSNANALAQIDLNELIRAGFEACHGSNLLTWPSCSQRLPAPPSPDSAELYGLDGLVTSRPNVKHTFDVSPRPLETSTPTGNGTKATDYVLEICTLTLHAQSETKFNLSHTTLITDPQHEY
jgi:hypothetical protein